MINYVQGDATQPELQTDVSAERPAIIVHCCNNIGGWGAGFVLEISNRWIEPERAYRDWANNKPVKTTEPFELGRVQLVGTSNPFIAVANLIGQDGIGPGSTSPTPECRRQDGLPPIRYDAIRMGMYDVTGYALEYKATVHMPRIGCGLAGGTWDKIEKCLKPLEMLNVETYVYDFE